MQVSGLHSGGLASRDGYGATATLLLSAGLDQCAGPVERQWFTSSVLENMREPPDKGIKQSACLFFV
jgi:hypothetical protein